jgi:hypothetical protein
MGIGRGIDRVAGQLSRVLHGLRGTKDNTVADLGPYLDLPAHEFFPTPPPLRDVRVHGSRLWQRPSNCSTSFVSSAAAMPASRSNFSAARV